MASDQAIQRAAVAVAMFDTGWPVPDLQLADHGRADVAGPLDVSLGRALLDLEAIPAGEQAVEAAVGLRILLVYVWAPAVLREAPAKGPMDDVQEHAMYIASHVTGAAPEETTRAATEAVRGWLGAPTVQRVIKRVADDLEDRRVMSGEVVEQRIRELLPSLGSHVDA